VVREVDQIIFDVNQRIGDVLGYNEQEVIGLPLQNIKAFMTEDVRQFFIQANDEIGYAERDCELKRKDGTIIVVKVTGIRISIEDHYYRMSIVQDITEQKLTEKEKEQARDSFLASQANLMATINNTELLMWSVDRDFKLITFNIPFARYVKHHYGFVVKPGDEFLERMLAVEGPETAEQWNIHYKRALAGEIVTWNDTHYGQDIQYSLSPIIEHNQVIGVSVFGDNVTESRTKDRQLAEANKKDWRVETDGFEIGDESTLYIQRAEFNTILYCKERPFKCRYLSDHVF
jgi:PAS domain S-box-containing protein